MKACENLGIPFKFSAEELSGSGKLILGRRNGSTNYRPKIDQKQGIADTTITHIFWTEDDVVALKKEFPQEIPADYIFENTPKENILDAIDVIKAIESERFNFATGGITPLK